MAEKSCVRPTPTLGEPTAAQLELPILVEPVLREPVAVPQWAAPRALNDLPLQSTAILWWLATLTRATYPPTSAYFSIAAKAVLPDEDAITFVQNVGLTPGYGLIIMPQMAILVVSGTTNLAQWQAQIFQQNLARFWFGAPPALKDAFVMNVYNSTAEAIYNATKAAIANRPVLCVGHSMGGAVAELVAAAVLGDDRRARCVTFASPKPGDATFRRGFPSDRREFYRVWCSNDFVVSLPPDLTALRMVAPPALATFGAQWDRYKQPGELNELKENGSLEAVPEPNPVLQIAGAVAAVAAGLPLSILSAHAIRTFVDRLRAGLPSLDEAVTRVWRDPNLIDRINADMTADGW